MRNRDKRVFNNTEVNDLEAYSDLLLDYNKVLHEFNVMKSWCQYLGGVNDEISERLTKLENRNWFERLFNIDINNGDRRINKAMLKVIGM